MAIEYRLRIDANEELCSAIRAGTYMPDYKVEESELHSNGVVAYMSSETPRGASVVNDVYGFKPTISITFRLDKGDDYEKLLIITRFLGEWRQLFDRLFKFLLF